MASQPNEAHQTGSPPPDSALSRALGRTRWVVLLAVGAVILVSLALFMLGVAQALFGLWHGGAQLLHQPSTPHSLNMASLSVEFLEIVSTLLKAVVFYLIGVGLYSLFIAPLSVAVALGVETLSDLDEMIVNIIVVLLAVTFLEHFIRWEKPLETLQLGAALALVVASLVGFQHVSHRSKRSHKPHNPEVTERARRELFQGEGETHEIRPEDAQPESAHPSS